MVGPRERPDAVVLAGGLSRRMGRNKALLPLPDGRTAVETVLSAARQVADTVFLAVDTMEHAAQLCESLAWRPTLLLDEILEGGPLAALASALHATSSPALLALAVDTPLVLADVLKVIYQAWRQTGDDTHGIAAPRIAGTMQPMPACYAARLRDVADVLLAAGNRSLQALMQAPDVQLSVVDDATFRSADPTLLSFTGANTPAE